MTGMRPSRCDRIRSLLSQGLDGAISEVERRAVARHTVQCTDCRAFEAQSRFVTEALRADRLLEPPHPVVVTLVRTRRVASRLVRNVASIAAVLLVSIGGWAVGSSVSTDASRPAVPPVPESLSGDALRALRVDALRAGELRILPDTPPAVHAKPIDW